MDFFDQQAVHRRFSNITYFLFFLSYVFWCVAVYVLLCASWRSAFDVRHFDIWDWHPVFYLVSFAIVWVMWFLGRAHISNIMGRTGAYLIVRMGGDKCEQQENDLRKQRLGNVIEEMAIAANIPTPTPYILPKQLGINAFALGYSIDQAYVAVTKGALDRLERDELQALVAHEMSHIASGDMEANTRMLSILAGLEFMMTLGWTFVRVREGGRIGAVLVIPGFFGFFLGNIIRSLHCRQREALADAMALQLTRNPDAMVSLMKKMGCKRIGSKIRALNSELCTHMFFGSAGVSLISTHPRLKKRILRIDPKFDGQFPKNVSKVEIKEP